MITLTRRDPLAGRLDSLFDEIFRPAFAREGNSTASEPLPIRLDVAETAEAYTVRAELPGVKRDQIQVEIEGNEVAISAETARENAAEGEKWLRVERYFGKTARRLALPVELDEPRAAAKFTDGVLELTLPKKATAAPRKIEIN